ncbi:MAG: type II toxin-antitoxin system RelE/ParE family toxin [Silvanigrellaceae bacterium]|nr:type II toxin-antitoxin system RelE/ParE family toxin [Silvanigrellaceae bacterium]
MIQLNKRVRKINSFKNAEFHKWAEQHGISDEVLTDAIKEMNQGGYEANLGGNVYKKRISLGNKGKSGGARTILAFKINDTAFFIYGFAKNKKDNVDEKDLRALKKLARIYLGLTDEELSQAVVRGELIKIEVKNG